MRTLAILDTLLLALASAATASAQAQYVETFDAVGSVAPGDAGPSGLESDGWIFRNQSDPTGSGTWKSGSFFSPQAGGGYLGVDSLSTGFTGGRISTWAILPDVPNQIAGDTLTLHVRASTSSNQDTLQVRYSPGGGRGTGSGATDVGDFSVLLLDLDPMPTGGWTQVSVDVPGSGPIALRYYEDFACNFTCISSELGFDSLSVGPPLPPPCNLPPIPAAGQAVTWTASGGPYEICTDVSIPATATVTVEPGVVIDVEPGFTLNVDGTLLANGVAQAPITLTGGISTVTPPVRVRGTAEWRFVDVACRIHVAHGGSAIVEDSTFPGGILSTDDDIGGPPRGTFVRVERSHFASTQLGGLSVTDGTLVVRDTTVTGPGGLRLLRGYLLADGVTVDGGGVSVIRERYTQPVFLDGFTVRNAPGPAFDLFGWDFFLGDNTLQDNLVPVSVTGGLLPGSFVPSAGNLNDHVDVGGGGVRGNATWGALGVPYVVDGFDQSGGHLTIEPGATVQFTPGSGVAYISTGDFRALGLPLQPIRFERRDPASAWSQILLVSMSTGPRFEHCVVEGSTFGVRADDSIVQVGSTRFDGNAEGAVSTTFGTLRVRSSRFTGNGTGLRTSSQGGADVDGSTNPSTFEGNGTGLLANGSSVDATDNWWGAADGPSPIGSGDPIAGPVSAVPFRTTPPPQDHPPVVRLLPAAGRMETGETVILSWEAQDDGAIVEQRVLFSEHGNGSSSFVQLAGDLPGTARSVELVVPTANPSSNNGPSFFKVVAVDDAGQEGFDELYAIVPYTEDVPASSLVFLTDLTGPFTFGEEIQVCWDFQGFSGTWNTGISIGGDMDAVGYGGGHTGIECWDFTMPYVSTDTARIALTFSFGAGGRTVTYRSQPFRIRPDARLGDAPPTVALTSPPRGSVFPGGGLVPLAWNATDDEQLRSFRVQASYDGGGSWHAVSRDLPGTFRNWFWRLPATSGLADVRLRVVATDLRFQSSTDEVAIEILPGGAPEAAPARDGADGPRATSASAPAAGRG